jgi:hypothetical protein
MFVGGTILPARGFFLAVRRQNEVIKPEDGRILTGGEEDPC